MFQENMCSSNSFIFSKLPDYEYAEPEFSYGKNSSSTLFYGGIPPDPVFPIIPSLQNLHSTARILRKTCKYFMFSKVTGGLRSAAKLI
jgi:hypothetical protein